MPDDDTRDLGIEWLASQLGESEAAKEPEPEPDSAEPEQPVAGGSAEPAAAPPVVVTAPPMPAVSPEPAVTPPVADAAAPTPAVPAVAATAPAEPVASRQSAVSPEPAVTPEPTTPPSAPDADTPTVAMPVATPSAAAPARAAPAQTPPAETEAPAPAVPAAATPTDQTGGFVWGLTPTVAPDPKLGASEVAEEPEEAHIPEAPARPVPAVPAAPAVPAVPAIPATPAVPAVPEAAAEVPPALEVPFEAVPATGVIRSEADLEPAPWWTTPVQSPLVPTTEEAAATQLLRTPEPAASVPIAPLPLDAPTMAAPLTAAAGRKAPRRGAAGAGRPSATRLLVWIAAGLLGVVVLVGLFFLGQRLLGGAAPVAAPSATPTATATPTPTPTPTAEPTGPQAVGVHAWDTLRGGECLQPYTSPWAEKFTVVDCATPHAAQLVYRGVFAGDAAAAFPGEAALAAQINLLCTAPGVIDLAAAGAFPDLQVQGSYPITAEQWTSGPRHYYCFVSRSSAEPLTVSIAGH